MATLIPHIPPSPDVRSLAKGRPHDTLRPWLKFQPYEWVAFAIIGIFLVPFWASGMLAFITAAGLQPIVRRLEHRHRGNHALLIVTLLSAFLVGITSYTGLRVVNLTAQLTAPLASGDPGGPAPKAAAGQTETSTPPASSNGPEAKTSPTDSAGPHMISALTRLRNRVAELATHWAPSYTKDIEQSLRVLPKAALAWIATHAQGMAASTMEILTQIFFYFLFLFFFLKRGRAIAFRLLRREPIPAARLRLWFEMVENASFTSVVSTAAIGFIQATIVAIGTTSMGYSEWGLIFFACFILSFVPIAGPATIPAILGISAFASGETKNGLVLLALSVFVGTIDNILRSFFVATDKDIHPIITFAALIGAIGLLGFPGLLIGPFCVSMGALLLSEKAREGFRPL